MARVGRTQGKHGGSRRGSRPRPSFRPRLFLLALGVTVAVLAWGYLVYAAVDFGTDARGGDTNAWWFLGLAAAGAVACLFVGLMLVVRLLRALGITSGPPPRQTAETVVTPLPPAPSTPSPSSTHSSGGKRAAR